MGTIIGRVRAVHTGWIGGPGLSTFYFQEEEGGTGVSHAAAQLMWSRVRAAFGTSLSLWPTQHRINVSTQIDLLDSANGELVGQEYFDGSVSEVSGTNTSGYGPLAVGMLLQLHTNTYTDGTRLKGRSYLSPASLGSDNNGTPDAGMRTLVQAIGDALLDEGIGGGPDLVVWRRPRVNYVGVNGPLDDRDGTVGKVIYHNVPDSYAVMRSRRD